MSRLTQLLELWLACVLASKQCFWALLTSTAKRTAEAMAWFIVKRGATLVAALVVLFSQLALVMFEPAKMYAVPAPAAKTVVVYVNGINTDRTGSINDRDLIHAKWNNYAASKGITTQPVFDYSYNQHIALTSDIAQAISQALNLPLNSILSDTNYSLLALWAYSNEAVTYRVRRSSFVDSDLTSLDNKVKCYLLGGTPNTDAATNVTTCPNPSPRWSGNKVVMLGHSQGGFYTNFAYEDILADTAFQAQLGVTLPNNNVLEVINLATPVSYSADGRYKYLTVCDDPIRFVPDSLPANYNNGNPFCGATQILTGATAAATGLAGYFENAFGPYNNPGIADAANAALGFAGNVFVEPHFLDNYLQDGSAQLQKVMGLLADSLPGPGCNGDPSCYLKDNFNSSDYTNNWLLTQQVGFPVAPYEAGNLILQSINNASGVAELTVRTRRVFTGSYTVSFTFQHLGNGQSTVRLRKAFDDSVVLALTVDSSSNAVSVLPNLFTPNATVGSFANGRNIVFSKTGTQMSLLVGGIQWITNASTLIDGYYLELDSQFTNIVQIQNLSVVRTALVGPIQPTTGTVGVTVSGYNGSISCALNGAGISAPATLSNKPAGSYALSCTAPTGYTISSITPSATQTLSGGGAVNFAVNLTATPATGSIAVLATMNGQPYSGAMACGFLNSPSNIMVNAVPFGQSNLPIGTYNLNCAGGPPNSQLQSFSPSSSQNLTAGGAITFTAVYTWAAVTVYSNPLPSPGSGSWTWSISAWSSSATGIWITQPVLAFAGVNYTYSHPEQYVLALQQIQNWGATGPIALMISQLQSALPYWPPYTIVPSAYSPPTISSYYWNNTPQNRVLFSGNFTGTGFVSGNSTVYFCVYNTTTCWQQPPVGVAVNSSISLSVYNVNLTSGLWQAQVTTPNGTALGPVFTVQ
jgi:hypothetical protein